MSHHELPASPETCHWGFFDAGLKPGPWMDATAPYLEGSPPAVQQLYALKDAADAKRFVDFWADAGATSFNFC